MDRKDILFLILFLIAGSLIIGYSYVRPDFNEVIEKDIKTNHNDYSAIIEEIRITEFNVKNGVLINVDKLPYSLTEKISKTKIGNRLNYLAITRCKADNDIAVDFVIGKWELRYSECKNRDFPLPGSHKEHGFIEIWGISSNWYIWIDNDFI